MERNDYITFSSNWFELLHRKKNVYQKVTFQGLYLYFQLHKFKLHGNNESTFVTSIAMLRKETGYSTELVLDLLKKLKGAKLIEIKNLSRWDYLKLDNGTINDHFPLHIVLKGNKLHDLTIPTHLINLYRGKKLSEKYLMVYCVIHKYVQTDGKSYISIEHMSDILGFDKDYIHKMIYVMNKHYLLRSVKFRKKTKEDEHYFEHILYDCRVGYERFIDDHRELCNQLLKNRVKANIFLKD